MERQGKSAVDTNQSASDTVLSPAVKPPPQSTTLPEASTPEREESSARSSIFGFS